MFKSSLSLVDQKKKKALSPSCTKFFWRVSCTNLYIQKKVTMYIKILGFKICLCFNDSSAQLLNCVEDFTKDDRVDSLLPKQEVLATLT